MKNLTIIITMAGMGSRFRNAGYNIPKFMILAKGKTLFEWSMDSLIGINQYVEKYIFIVQKKDNAKDFIYNICHKYGIFNLEIIEIEKITDGQATTCMFAIPFCNSNSPILIYNIDTYVEPYSICYKNLTGDGHIPCFHADGDHWSFVKLDADGNASEVREKNHISDNCSIGAYYFSSAQLFKETYEEFYPDSKHTNGEKYIAPMYNLLIKKGKKITITLIDPTKVHVLGTPEELNKFIKL